MARSMNDTTLSINDIDLAAQKVQQLWQKLIFVAGASASGKSYFAKQLEASLKKKKKRVLSISSDDYYDNNTGLNYVLYGTFDHPNMIRYDLLKENLDTYMSTGSMSKPQYSFMEKRVTHHDTVTEESDYIIVEWLYTIHSLQKDFPDSTSIFVYSPREELIFRRIIRDQERVKEPSYMIINNIGKAFPMRNLYGKKQEEQADIIINNGYEILDHKWSQCTYERFDKAKKTLGTLDRTLYSTNFVYEDNSSTNGDIIISENYLTPGWLLDHVVISKVKHKTDSIEQHIDIKVYEPGMLTDLHILMQTAGLAIADVFDKKESTYQDGPTATTIVERDWKSYTKCD
jgi:uridine kinase